MQLDKSRTIKMVSALAVIFVVPVVIAWYLYFHTNHEFLKQSNKGQLILKPFQVSQLDIQNYQHKKVSNDEHKWTIMYWTENDCTDSCKKTIDKLLRVRMVMGKDMLRTQAWLATSKPVAQDLLPKLEDVNGFNTKPLILVKDAAAKQHIFAHQQHILLIDPNGNVMMRYQQDTPPKAIHSDLKRLLKVSKIG